MQIPSERTSEEIAFTYITSFECDNYIFNSDVIAVTG